ncbi:protein Brevis radix-like 1 isoform X1 [Cynara cardunculus var. scolymus]|uniref:protein Brevis radix-like 1 isoform X1 n=1 Tax=Cynara cardunculus var. scolymus TaxID=59895 RepID=UPI000D630A8E|nr:protein Brevis radix-like 1 isoform X1 [Cynara cardunculus var. scolymus]XP_024986047.1 protein Brevis radix-like 1 isoform X1 [Cynara cardunculus var. scolymus]
MLTCITCSKQQVDDEGEEVGARGNKDAVKTLTTQMKDMALKASGSSKGKPPTGPSSFKRAHTDYDSMLSKGYMHSGGSSSSTAPWDFNANGGYEPPRQSGHLVLDDDDDPTEWMAQVEPGVQITFVSLPNGGNDLKRIRFNREMFDKWQAQRWWGENYDRIMELYNVQRFNCQALDTPSRSEDGRDSTYSRFGSVRDSPMMNPIRNNYYKPPEQINHYNASSMDASRTTTSSRDETSVSISNASDMDSEWIEEDEPGVYITIRQLVDGTRELRRVRFSREKFGEVHAKQWWEQNRERIQSQYL